MSDTDRVVPYIYTGDGITTTNFTAMAYNPAISALRSMFNNYYASLDKAGRHEKDSEFPVIAVIKNLRDKYYNAVNNLFPQKIFEHILAECFSETYLGLALVDRSNQSGNTPKGFIVAEINGEEKSATILYGYIGNNFSIEEGFKKLIKSLKLELSNNDITYLKAVPPIISPNTPGILTVETLMNNGFSLASDGSLCSPTRQNNNEKQI